MSSVIYYKFANSTRSLDAVEFSGVALTVDAVKRAIVANKKLRGADDEQLILTNSASGEEYRNDHALVPKNATVTVRRVPAVKHRTLTLTQRTPPPPPPPAAPATTTTPPQRSPNDIPLCPLCGRPCADAAIIDCCYVTFCERCIRERIAASSKCPNCGTADVRANNVKPNSKVRERERTRQIVLPSASTPRPVIATTAQSTSSAVSAASMAVKRRERGDEDPSTSKRRLVDSS